MKSLLSLLFLATIATTLFSQKSVLTVSDDFKVKDKGYKNQFVSNSAHIDGFFYTVSNSSVSGTAKAKYVFVKLYDIEYGITISKFDKNMNMVKKLELEDGKKEFGPVNPDIFLFQNKPYIAYFKQEDKSAFSFYIAPINTETLELGKSIKVYTRQQENANIFKLQKVLDGTNIHVTLSPDQQKMWILIRDESTKLESFIFDKDLTVIKKNNFNLRYEDAIIHSLFLSDNLDQLFFEGNADRVTIAFQSGTGKGFQEYLKGKGDMTPLNVNAKISQDGKRFIIAATSSSADKYVGCNGFLMYDLDCKTATLSNPKTYPYSTDFFEAMDKMGTFTKERKKVINYHHFVPGILELENGKIAITGSPERTIVRQVTTSSTSVSGAMRTSTNTVITHYVGPIIVFFPKEGGRTFTYAVVPRSFTFGGGVGMDMKYINYVHNPDMASKSKMNYIALNKGNEILILYNTTPDNLNLKDLSKLKNAKTANNVILAETRVNPSNLEVTSYQLGDKTINFSYLFESLVPGNSNQIIFPIGRERLRWTYYGKRDLYTNYCFIAPSFR